MAGGTVLISHSDVSASCGALQFKERVRIWAVYGTEQTLRALPRHSARPHSFRLLELEFFSHLGCPSLRMDCPAASDFQS